MNLASKRIYRENGKRNQKRLNDTLTAILNHLLSFEYKLIAFLDFASESAEHE